MSTDDGVQWVSTAWINAMRDEALRVGRDMPEVARVVGIGVWIATFAGKDGSNAFPSRETLATLAACSQETVTRAVKVLIGVGVLERRRRPNTSAMYQLSTPLGSKGLPWDKHIHHMTETRQRKAHAKAKAERLANAARTASVDAVENPAGPVENRADSVRGRGPDSVRVGGSGTPGNGPDSVRGRPRTASVDAFRTASMDAPTKPFPTSGRDHPPHHNLAGLSPQPPTRAREAVKDESSTGAGEALAGQQAVALAAVRAREPLARCTGPDCGIQLPYGASGLCDGCRDYLATTDRERHSA